MSTRLRSLTFRLFVRLCAADILDSVYLGILARAPDSAGRDAYAEKLREASDLTNVLSEIIRSDEFREKSIAALAPELVRAAFQGVLERVPEPRALTFYAQSLAAKKDVSALISEILRSEEFREKSLAALAPQLVQATYRGLLGREPEAQALASLAQNVAAGKDLAALLSDTIHSDEFREGSLAALAPQLVRAAYQGLLEREPEPEALASYAQSLAAKKDVSALLNAILRSQEFREKSLAALAPQLVQATYQGLLERAPEPKALTSYSQSLAA